MTPPRLLVLALDAASPALLRQWGADGTLPAIGRLLREGLSGPARSLEGFYHGSTWPSFMTGRSPGSHGIYWMHQAGAGEYDRVLLTPEQIGRHPALWDVLARAGKRVAVLDVPFDAPRPAFSGLQAIEWYSHDPLFGFQSTPPSVAAEIERIEGRHPAPASCDAVRRDRASCRRFIDELTRGAALRSRIACRLLTGSSWDVAIQVFAETHCAGHQLWHLHDSAHPGHDPDLARETGDGIREVYVAVDKAVGAIVETVAGPETTVLLIDLHGMSFMTGAGLIIPEVLERLGYVTRLPPPPPPRFLPRTFGPLWRGLPDGLRNALTPLKRLVLGPPPPSVPRGVAQAQFIPERSRCFWLNLGTSVSGVRLNLIGRERNGVLRPEEAESFAATLTEELLALRNLDTGHPVVERVRRGSDLCPGPMAHLLPDLVIDWDLSQPLGSAGVGTGRGSVLRISSPRTGLIEVENRSGRSGEHRNEGLFVARGPGIRPGTLDRSVSTLDYAPTIAAMLGCGMPADGQVIHELLTE
jgi:predicted AlkP superfamily phosphohydrolase/phosphomutase